MLALWFSHIYQVAFATKYNIFTHRSLVLGHWHLWEVIILPSTVAELEGQVVYPKRGARSDSCNPFVNDVPRVS